MNGNPTTIEGKQLAALEESRNAAVPNIPDNAETEEIPEEESGDIAGQTIDLIMLIAAGIVDAIQIGLQYILIGTIINPIISVAMFLIVFLWTKFQGMRMPPSSFLKNWGTWLSGGAGASEAFLGFLPVWSGFILGTIVAKRLRKMKSIGKVVGKIT